MKSKNKITKKQTTRKIRKLGLSGKFFQLFFLLSYVFSLLYLFLYFLCDDIELTERLGKESGGGYLTLFFFFTNSVSCLIFIRARTLKKPKCSSREEWIKKMWYIYINTM